jgi:hypothetical protein
MADIPSSSYATDMAKRAWTAVGLSPMTPVEVIAAHIDIAMAAVVLEAKLWIKKLSRLFDHVASLRGRNG